jgi:hypothetical protein
MRTLVITIAASAAILFLILTGWERQRRDRSGTIESSPQRQLYSVALGRLQTSSPCY